MTIATMLTGINIEGFNWPPSPQYPVDGTIAYYLAKGFLVFRIPLAWELLQPQLYGPLDLVYLAQLDRVIAQVAVKPGAHVILDLHDDMRRGSSIVGESVVTAGHMSNLWTRMALRYGKNSDVWYGLMNEPHDVDSATLAITLNGSIEAIRRITESAILIPGNDWNNGERWLQSGNDVLASRMTRAATNTIWEVHQYLDTWGAGQSPIAQPGSGHRLDAVTEWAKRNGCRLFLGEVSCGSDPASLAELRIMLDMMRGCSNWVGYSWWSSLGGHPDPNRRWYNLDPLNGQDMPQMALLHG